MSDNIIRILLVNPNQVQNEKNNWAAPSLGINRVASYLRKKASSICEVDVYDPVTSGYSLTETANDEIKKHYDIIGFSLIHENLAKSLSLIWKMKALYPETLFIAGGPEATENYQEILDNSPIDCIFLGEGEESLKQLVQYYLEQYIWSGKDHELREHELIEFSKIPGIIWRKYSKPITLEALREYWFSIDFKSLQYEKFWKQTEDLYKVDVLGSFDLGREIPINAIRCVRLVTTTHCNFPCTYCSVSRVHYFATGQRVAPVSLTGKDVYDLLVKIKSEVPSVRTIYFCEDNFLFYRERFEEFYELCKANSLELEFLIQTHSGSLSEDIVQKLSEIGCRHVTVGVENASEEIRKSLKKPQNSARISNIINWCKDSNINPYYLIMLFPPESTVRDLEVNYLNIKDWIAKGVQISIEPVIYAYRGASLWLDEDKYQTLYEKVPIEGTDRVIKNPLYILPKDPIVREIAVEFKKREKDYVARRMKETGHDHSFKGITGQFLNDLLGELLKEYRDKDLTERNLL